MRSFFSTGFFEEIADNLIDSYFVLPFPNTDKPAILF
jgi:hypothetical protein